MRLLTVILTVLLFFMFFGCGADGEKGDVYLAIDWDWYVDAYWDDNDGIPYNFSRNRDYKCEPGSYNFKYYCSDYTDDWMWQGTYTLTANEGQPGEFLSDGANGDTKYYKFYLKGLSQPTLTVHKPGAIQMFLSKDIEKYENKNWAKSGDIVREIWSSKTGEKIEIVKQLYILK